MCIASLSLLPDCQLAKWKWNLIWHHDMSASLEICNSSLASPAAPRCLSATETASGLSCTRRYGSGFQVSRRRRALPVGMQPRAELLVSQRSLRVSALTVMSARELDTSHAAVWFLLKRHAARSSKSARALACSTSYTARGCVSKTSMQTAVCCSEGRPRT